MIKSNSDKKDGKANIPNGFQINPGLMQGLQAVTLDNIFMFLWSNRILMPSKEEKIINKLGRSIIEDIILSFVFGSLANFAITKIAPKITILPSYIRIPVRLAIFASPGIYYFPKANASYENINQIMFNRFIKIQKFRKTGNVEEYFA